MPRPEIQKHEAPRERICAECRFFTFRVREPGDKAQGWAFCKKRNRHFPRQGGIVNIVGVFSLTFDFAGKRTCSYWE
jgi:hypothetical protein